MRKDIIPQQIWEQGWDGHQHAQAMRMAHLSLSEKLEWLEQAHHLVLHISTMRGKKSAPSRDS